MIGRNEPCWCGSGKKYKKCHLRQDKEQNRGVQKNPLIKSADEIEKMRAAGAFNASLMDYLRPFIVPGISTEKINSLAHEYTLDHGHRPATLGYHGFPKSLCTSINNVVCHGIPSSEDILRDGDIVNVDITTVVDGYFGDQSETFLIGAVSPPVKELVRVTAEATMRAIGAIAPGRPLSIVGDEIDPFVRQAGYSVVRSYTGHGIGSRFHENMTVLHHKNREGRGTILEPGMTFTIEPMVNMGGYAVYTDRTDGWTVYTKDGSLSAQFEHTLLVTDDGYEVLTQTASQKEAGTLIVLPE
ncbi:type I methionyl aminopeptidase [Chitinivibrio alkaliphilus]|uniref:Methionine aminopeptidase n=1 Tax=Chitinivibrio alkaliphilus ACht1 TaxID=1313304 RepID=U7D6T3_9BACT|nr:type I methionyl aminopeptidase [Chitinivibrio alkaliphilus]ERP38675.1 methionine aminopeptidase, type I [Chitinivibrio alkaliphilus ACht1]